MMRTLRSRLLISGVFLLLLVLAMTLAACGEKEPRVTTPEVTTPPSSYSITFRVNGVDHTSEVPVGEMPVFEGSTLRPSDDANTYRFIGWDKEFAPATESTVYTALYETLPLVTYEIRWSFSDGFFSSTVKEGHTPAVPDHVFARYEGECQPVPLGMDRKCRLYVQVRKRVYVLGIERGERLQADDRDPGTELIPHVEDLVA